MKKKDIEASFWKTFFGSKFFILIVLLLLAFTIHAFWGESKDYAVDRSNLEKLNKEVEELEQQNVELAGLIKYLRSDEYAEKEIRQNLNMQKPGEKVVIVPSVEEMAEVLDEQTGRGKKSNPQLWAEYFFE